MRYTEIGKSGIKGSIITLGTWEMSGGSVWNASDETSNLKIIDRAHELGINMLDTAPSYGIGSSEEFLAKALKGRRHDYIVATKCGLNWRDTEGNLEYSRNGKNVYRNLSAKSLKVDLEQSLKRLQTDYIDIYMTHRQSNRVPVEETMNALLEMKKEGKIRAIGISNGSPEILREYMKYGQVDLAQEAYNVLMRNVESEYIPACEEAGTTLHGFMPLCRGVLAGKLTMDYQPGPGQSSVRWYSPELRGDIIAMQEEWKRIAAGYNCSAANLAVAFILAKSKNVNAVVGVRRMANLEDTVKAADLILSDSDLNAIQASADKIIQKADNLNRG